MASPSRREIDAVYPEPLSRLTRVVESSAYKRASKKKMNRSSGRFRTTPVTFDEIKEVDEECDTTITPDESDSSSIASNSRSEHDLRRQFESFMDRMARRKPRNVNQSTGSSFEEDDIFELRPGRSRPQSIPEIQDTDEFSKNYYKKSRPSI